MLYDFYKFLQGKKAYVLCLVAVVYAVSGFILGQIDQQTMLNMIWAALTGIALRAGITKSGPTASQPYV